MEGVCIWGCCCFIIAAAISKEEESGLSAIGPPWVTDGGKGTVAMSYNPRRVFSPVLVGLPPPRIVEPKPKDCMAFFLILLPAVEFIPNIGGGAGACGV